MKYLYLVLAMLASAVPQCQISDYPVDSDIRTSLSTIDAAGGDGSGTGGTLAFSVGQVFYDMHKDEVHSFHQGVQNSLPQDKPQPILLPKTEFKISTYPNPVDDFFIIETSDLKDKNISYKLFDLSGKLIVKDQLVKTRTKINAYNLQSSLYLLYLIEDGQHMRTIKILKK